jgi:heat shock protein HtpX
MIQHSLVNRLYTLLLFASMLALLAVIGLSIAGRDGLFWAVGLGVLLMWLGTRVSSRLVLRMFGARPLSVQEAPELYRLVQNLAQRAGLSRIPQLYFIRNRGMNAFSVGTRDQAALALTDELLHRLNQRELTGVLAHEITHIRHNDVRVKALADMISRITQLFSTFGQILLFLNLPLLLMGMGTISWLMILLLIFAPTLSGLLQLALARTREFEADLGAVRLTQDPEGLASALRKMEQYELNLRRGTLIPGHQINIPALLRTHPETEKRVQRLLDLVRADANKDTSRVEWPQTADAARSPISHRLRWNSTQLGH